jgi:hypothetical protein
MSKELITVLFVVSKCTDEKWFQTKGGTRA